jgi:hypothetical protein
MPQLNWNVSVQVTKGPNFTCAGPALQVEAIDQVAVSIEPGDAEMLVELQPGAAKDIHLIVIQSSYYGPELTYAVSDGKDQPSESLAVTLDGPQIFTCGSAALFNVDTPRQLKFTNSSTSTTAAVTITVARDATPDPSPT